MFEAPPSISVTDLDSVNWSSPLRDTYAVINNQLLKMRFRGGADGHRRRVTWNGGTCYMELARPAMPIGGFSRSVYAQKPWHQESTFPSYLICFEMAIGGSLSGYVDAADQKSC